MTIVGIPFCAAHPQMALRHITTYNLHVFHTLSLIGGIKSILNFLAI